MYENKKFHNINIIISGYGKMGKEVEKVALERGHSIFARIDNENEWNALHEKLPDNALVVDFSLPGTVVENIYRCFAMKIPVVTGTTGWYQHLNEIKEQCRQSETSLFYAPNFSLGVNILFYLNKRLAQIMSQIDGYRPEVIEIHHIHKLDAPSGTAIQLAEDILKKNKYLQQWVNRKTEKQGELSIVSKRIGEVPGTHKVVYTSIIDKISLKHEAKSRKGFAFGAILAAEFLLGKKGIFTIDDLLKTFGI